MQTAGASKDGAVDTFDVHFNVAGRGYGLVVNVSIQIHLVRKASLIRLNGRVAENL
jgi:hypothetical protein